MKGQQLPTGNTPSSRQEFLNGVRDMLPLLIGVAPFGLIFGALALAEGVPPTAAAGFSLFVFAGSAQFIAAGLIGAGAPPVVIVATILVVNLRHLLYSASMAPHYQKLPGRWRAALAWLLTDEAFATSSIRFRVRERSDAHWYALGTGLALWAAWQLSTVLGVAIGAQVPRGWSLDFALPLTFMALLFPTLVNRPAWVAALTAAFASVLLAGLPFRLGLLIAVVIGVGAGAFSEGLHPPPQASFKGIR